MDARRQHSNRFLATAALLIFAFASSTAEQAQKGATYVVPSADKCSQTKIRVELDGIAPLPSEVTLKVWRTIDDKEVVSQQVSLSSDGKYYYWSGLLVPLGKYKAQLFNAKDKSVSLGIPFSFNNIDILRSFVEEERGEITYLSRGGDSADPQAASERQILSVGQLPTPNGHNQIHIIVINDRANKGDEYFGQPPREQVWRSKPLFLGKYWLLVVEYQDDGSCRVIRGR